jgi:thioredoxin reductase
MSDLAVDVVVVGGGPAGLSAALALGRAVKKVLLCDAGARRNAAAEHMHGFVTRDGIPPAEFRRIAREQLRPYGVVCQDAGVRRVEATAGGFAVTLTDGARVTCRRVLLATGMVDEIPDVPGVRELWGHSVFVCPYCHGWEVRGRRWGVLATDPKQLESAIFVTGWTTDVVVFTNGAVAIPPETRARLDRAGVVVEERRIERVVAGPDRRLTSVELMDGAFVPCDAMVVRPPQRQIELVRELDLELDAQGFVRVDDEAATSVPGIHAAGDLVSPMQAAVFAAAAGTRAAYLLNHRMNMERGA